jgi:Beta-lactamase class C and other penicillin binding proteins
MRPAIVLAALLLAAPASAGSLDTTATAALAGTNAPGLALLTMRHGKITGEGISGVERNDGKVPLTANEVWHIGSDGKPMTATLLAKLVDQKKVAWTSTLAELLPDMAKAMRPEYRSVTVIQLLTHTAGFDHDTNDEAFFNSFYKDPRTLTAQRASYAAKVLSEAPAVPPGTKFSYSNSGFILAAVIAERITGKSYETLIKDEVFRPLGMNSVGFGVVPPGKNSGHHDGKPTTPEDGNPAAFAPAGNMYMTMHDWAAFCLDQMAGVHGSGKILKPETYRFMQTVHQPSGTGISWGVQDTVAGRKGPALTHAGSDTTWYAIVVLFPESQSGVLAAANAGDSMGGDKATSAAFKAVVPSVTEPVPAK